VFGVFFRFQVAQEGTARAHHVHGMGVGRNHFQCRFQFFGQATQGLDFGAIGFQLLFIGQFAIQDQVGHFQEFGLVSQFRNIVTAVGEPGARDTHGAQFGLSGDLPAQAGAANFLFSHDDLLCWCRAQKQARPVSKGSD